MLELLRLPAVLKTRGRGRSSHYLDIKQGLFTKQVQLGANCVGWPAHEVDAINSARLAGKSEDEIRKLVDRLESARKEAR